MTPAIDPDEREEIQELFDEADADGDRRIDCAELLAWWADR